MNLKNERDKVIKKARKDWRKLHKAFRRNDGAILIREFAIMESPKHSDMVIIYHGPSARFRGWPIAEKEQMVKELKASDELDHQIVLLIWEV